MKQEKKEEEKARKLYGSAGEISIAPPASEDIKVDGVKGEGVKNEGVKQEGAADFASQCF